MLQRCVALKIFLCNITFGHAKQAKTALSSSKTKAKKSTKTRAARANLSFLFRIRSIDFVAVLIAGAV